MGQARIRGNRDTRVAEAREKQLRQQPPALVCSGCQQPLGSVAAVPVDGLTGLQAAYRAHCAACDLHSWAVRGEPAAVKAFYAALEKASGQTVQLGRSAAQPLP